MKINNSLIRIKDVSFIELLVSTLLIQFAILFFFLFFFKIQEVARDSARKRDITQIGQIITNPCFIPNQTTDKEEYDLHFILKEMGERDGIYQMAPSQTVEDPKTGAENISMYIYQVSKDGQKCSLYANLESSFNKETLKITEPTPGEGTGILKDVTDGWNGSPFYFQYSNK